MPSARARAVWWTRCNPMIKLTAKHESFPIAGTFTISRGSKTTVEVVVVELTENGVTGRGECVPYARYGETHGADSPADLMDNSIADRPVATDGDITRVEFGDTSNAEIVVERRYGTVGLRINAALDGGLSGSRVPG